MATGESGQLVHSFEAAADLSAKQFFAMQIDTAGKINLGDGGAAAPDVLIGVLQNKPKAGEAGQVQSSGITKAVAGATVTAGADLTSDSTGRFVAAITTDIILGICLQGAAVGEVFSMLIVGPYESTTVT